MICPNCGHSDTSVLDSRVTRGGKEIRRRRECKKCSHRFTTYERPEERIVYIVKKDKRREAYSREKVHRGLRKACEKLDIPNERLEAAVNRISRRLNDLTMDEVKSKTLGAFVMEELFDIDEVAYIRFASVYLAFQETGEFINHIEELRRKKSVRNRQRKPGGEG